MSRLDEVETALIQSEDELQRMRDINIRINDDLDTARVEGQLLRAEMAALKSHQEYRCRGCGMVGRLIAVPEKDRVPK